jgi:hemolysin activation/secretion protein
MALASTNRGRRYELDALVPYVGSSRTHADVWFTYLQRATDFHGIGPESFPDLDTEFTLEQRSYQGSLSRDLADHLQTGVYAQAKSTRSVLDELSTRSTVASLGAFLSFDTRDNSRGLTRGVNLFGRIATAKGLGDSSGLYGWTETELDARGHIPLGGPRTALLVRSRAEFKSPRNGARIPYYDLSWLGGRMFVRGTSSYRFRGNNTILLASELQRTVVPLTPVRGVDVFASADTGQVWMDRREFTQSGWRSGLGGGVQYRHSSAMAVRVEMSHGVEGTQTYFALSRGF